MEEKKNKSGKIIGIVIAIIVLAIIGYVGYQYYDDYKWKKYHEEHNIDDNLLTVKCFFEAGEEKIISCTVDTEAKTSEYENVSIFVEHSDSVKYITHTVPTDGKIYDSHQNTSYRNEKEQEHFYVAGLDDLEDLDYLLNIKFELLDENATDEELKFKYMKLSKDFIDHNTEDVIIKLNELATIEMDSETGTYKYLCLNKDLDKDAVIYRNMLSECTSEKELSVSTLTDGLMKSYGLNLADSYDDTTYYLKSAKKENDFITLEDVYWKLEPLAKTEIKSQTGIDYSLKLDEDKALYINDTKIFSDEKVKDFYIRPYCCTGGKKILLITESGKAYITNEDVDLKISSTTVKLESITFKDLNLSNIKEFHINLYAPSMAGTHVYAIDDNGEEHLVD